MALKSKIDWLTTKDWRPYLTKCYSKDEGVKLPSPTVFCQHTFCVLFGSMKFLVHSSGRTLRFVFKNHFIRIKGSNYRFANVAKNNSFKYLHKMLRLQFENDSFKNRSVNPQSPFPSSVRYCLFTQVMADGVSAFVVLRLVVEPVHSVSCPSVNGLASFDDGLLGHDVTLSSDSGRLHRAYVVAPIQEVEIFRK